MIGGRCQQPARGGEQERQGCVVLTLLMFIGVAAPVDHPQNGTNLRDRRQQADGDIAAAFVKAFEDLRRPDADRAERIGQAEVGQGVHQHDRREHFPPQAALLHGVMADRPFRLDQRQAVVVHHLLQAFFIFCGQPFGLRRRIIQPEPDHNTEQHRREAFQQEQPLPAVQVQQAVHRQDIAGDDRPQRGGHRHRDHKQRVGAGAEKGREPVGQIEQNAGQKTGLGDPHQHAQDIEAVRPGREHGGGGGDAPQHHDGGDPAASANDAEHHVAGNAEYHVGGVKQGGGKTEHGGVKAQILAHGQPGKADIDAI